MDPSADLHTSYSDPALAIQQAAKNGCTVVYYTHPHSLPTTGAAKEGIAPHSHEEKLPRDKALLTEGDFSFLPFPNYCGLTVANKVFYKHHLSIEMPQ
ncbi:hypothetical protein ERJ75_001173400 [Trypanosoma vivax]|nr:hypothetical protein ERJ75_001173400 [Trypanosoma vivax]